MTTLWEGELCGCDWTLRIVIPAVTCLYPERLWDSILEHCGGTSETDGILWVLGGRGGYNSALGLGIRGIMSGGRGGRGEQSASASA